MYFDSKLYDIECISKVDGCGPHTLWLQSTKPQCIKAFVASVLSGCYTISTCMGGMGEVPGRILKSKGWGFFSINFITVYNMPILNYGIAFQSFDKN